MKSIKIISLIFVLGIFSLVYGKTGDSSARFDPTRMIKFLDRNGDHKISKDESKKAKRLNENFDILDKNNDGYITRNELGTSNQTSRYTYLESDGVFVYYETKSKETYKELLPPQFELSDRYLVLTFISDFYKMDSETKPYKEAAIFLLAKYNGNEVWHCIYMPVTSKESMMLGRSRLGLPKSLGEIDIVRNKNGYSGELKDKDGNQMNVSINFSNKTLSVSEMTKLEKLTQIPKMNILNGEVFEMNRNDQNRSVFEVTERFPDKLQMMFGEGQIQLLPTNDLNKSLDAHPLKLDVTEIIGCYYLKNKLPFKFGKK